MAVPLALFGALLAIVLRGLENDVYFQIGLTMLVALAVTLPVFTAGSISGQVKQAEALQQQALFQYQKAIQVAFQEVADALVSLQNTREQLAVQGREVDALATYSRLARLRYEGGYTSYIEVLDAERSLFIAQLSYAQTQGVVVTSSVNLYKAIGGVWVTDAERMMPVSYSSNGAVQNPAAGGIGTGVGTASVAMRAMVRLDQKSYRGSVSRD